MHDKEQPLPMSDEVLLCSSNTTKDEVDIFLRRALYGDGKKIHCLVNADLLDYDVREAAKEILNKHLLETNHHEKGIDFLLFNLLILDCLMDRNGYVWRRSKDDLYLIETMPIIKINRENQTSSVDHRKKASGFMSVMRQKDHELNVLIIFYERHPDELIKKLEKAGLGYHVDADETTDKRCIGFNRFLKVCYLLCGILGSSTLKLKSCILGKWSNELFVSLRDVECVLTVMAWFYGETEDNRYLYNEMDKKLAEQKEYTNNVAFIGISNWALDPAKMNRGILVQREVPNLEELKTSAKQWLVVQSRTARQEANRTAPYG
ncbi:hypothetical protein DPMN_054482 [Dreissena polymorpha]|uniref:Uncharacterized protein n=1 Tax=Dreissena polymorpha TaxID=45954 RepID=A0A9D4CQN6_DREPO|nr:hypothetical protein DPMN_054482 [Dreissena polymorpha]